MEPRNRFRGIEFASLCSLAGQYDTYVFVPARLAENRYLVSLKDLQIRALAGRSLENSRKERDDLDIPSQVLARSPICKHIYDFGPFDHHVTYRSDHFYSAKN